MGEPKIIDMIVTSHGQRFLIIDKMPEFLYEKKDDILFGKDGPFASRFYYQVDRFAKAFAGHKFTLKLNDGGELLCDGKWWHSHPEGYCSIGISTLDELRKCYVFVSAAVDPSYIEDWLKLNNPKTEYYYYQKKRGEL